MSGSATLTDGWTAVEVLVTVKAYPSISTKYGEAICVAGVRLDTPELEWFRLFPVAFRDLPYEQQFRKYEIVRVLAQRHSTDRRAETRRPRQETFERVRPKLPAGGAWPERRKYVEPLIGPTTCDLVRQEEMAGRDVRSKARGNPLLEMMDVDLDAAAPELAHDQVPVALAVIALVTEQTGALATECPRKLIDGP